MRKYSSIFWWLMLFGVVSLIFTITTFIEHLATPSAFGAVWTFIFFWVACMLPDNEKYKDHG